MPLELLKELIEHPECKLDVPLWKNVPKLKVILISMPCDL